MAKWVYQLDEFRGAEKPALNWDNLSRLLGKKGTSLAQMKSFGLPAPQGFIITTQACKYYFKHARKYPPGLAGQVKAHLARLEKLTGLKFGNSNNPLLVSMRSGAARSVPGLMQTILNLGLNEESVEALARNARNDRFAWDAYRRFVQMYSTVVMGLPRDDLEAMLLAIKQRLRVKDDTEVSAAGWRDLVRGYKEYFRNKTGQNFPEDPKEQLWGAIGAAFESWMTDKAISCRRLEKMTALLGTSVSVVQMVFGNRGEDSGVGFCFTRDPSTGEKVPYGEFLSNSQGEEVMAGIRTPLSLDQMAQQMPKLYSQVEAVARKLETVYKDMQDFEFVMEWGTMWLLMTRTAKRSGYASLRVAIDFLDEGLIKEQEAIFRVRPEDLVELLIPKLSKDFDKPAFARGIGAVRGIAKGRAVFDFLAAEDLTRAGNPVILIRAEISPEDIEGILLAEGVITIGGGRTSHAAVVCRGLRKPCIVGLEVETGPAGTSLCASGEAVKEGDWITIDGTSGVIYRGDLPLTDVDMRDQPYLKRYAELIWAMNSDDFIESSLGLLWLLRDTIRERVVQLPFVPSTLTPRPPARPISSRYRRFDYLGFVQPPARILRRVLKAMHWQHDSDTSAVVWGTMQRLMAELQDAVGIGNHHFAIRPLCDPEQSFVDIYAHSVIHFSGNSGSQLVGIEFFGINRWIHNYLPWSTLQWWVLVNPSRDKPQLVWRLDYSNPHGETVLPGEGTLEAFLFALNGQILTFRETRLFYAELRKRELAWDWYEENNISRREVIYALERAKRGRVVDKGALTKCRSIGLVGERFRLTTTGLALLSTETAQTRKHITFPGRSK